MHTRLQVCALALTLVASGMVGGCAQQIAVPPNGALGLASAGADGEMRPRASSRDTSGNDIEPQTVAELTRKTLATRVLASIALEHVTGRTTDPARLLGAY